MSGIPHYFLYGEKSPSEALQHVHIVALEQSLPKHHWEIHPHRHDNLHQLLIIQQGDVLANIEERSRQEKGPCMLSIPPTTVHGFIHQPEVRGYIITITQTFLGHLFDDTERQQFSLLFHKPLTARPEPDSHIAWSMEHLVPQLLNEYNASESGQSSMIGAYLKVLFILLHRALKPEQQLITNREERISHFEQFMVLLEAHYTEHWSISEYANALNMTSGKLNQLCHHYAGQNALPIIHDRLITEAKRQLIYTQLSAKEIAYKLGFKDTGYFSRFFNRKCGTTAGKFRRMVREQRQYN